MKKDWFLYCCAAAILIIFLLFICSKANAETNTVSSTVTGTTTVDKSPSTASAPSVVVNNQDVCTTGASAAVQTQILGIAGATVNTDENCERLKLSRALYGMGMKVAAVSVLCQDPRVFDAMEMAGTPCPYFGTIGETAQAGWDSHPEHQPGYKEPSNAKKYWIGGGILLAITTGILLF
ncbi:MAG: hypothetical protein DA439_05650 [Bacteroidetes bacterium]|jgi:hypothetical protein|nr:MAG: hypothetical protein DA439_05650 [Bacteroidota bacterium]